MQSRSGWGTCPPQADAYPLQIIQPNSFRYPFTFTKEISTIF